MNIKRAKEEIKRSVSAYLVKDEFGEYKMPVSSQRPLFLMGPPGIGKTAIMEQVSRELRIGLVAYTITHHTRQSAVGLPYIEKKEFGGNEYSVTEYTMSEIIASVYNTMEKTGLTEGILFIDEINCVSETLAATMLQFLQQKSFGNHKVPKGWVIVTAGNPPEYNKSVHEYDLVTLDRIRKLEVAEDYEIWKEYAYGNSIHGSIITYLDLKKDNFYVIENTVDGIHFVTARGWEDLSKLIYLYEELDLQIDEALVYQYIQHRKIAKDFANYLDFYHRYKKDYRIQELLDGSASYERINEIRKAPFDEKLTLIGLVLDQLYSKFKEVSQMDLNIRELFEVLKKLKVELLKDSAVDKEKSLSTSQIENGPKDSIVNENTPYQILGMMIDSIQTILDQNQKDRLLEKSMLRAYHNAIVVLSEYQRELRNKQLISGEEAFAYIRDQFNVIKEQRSQLLSETSILVERAFAFMEECFGVGQELVIFITELTMNHYSSNYIGNYGSEKYDQYSKELMYEKRTEAIQSEILTVLDELRM